MKIVLTSLIFVVIMGCRPVNSGKGTFTITKIQQEKDGQTLYLMDSKNNLFTTVISIPNGNYIAVSEGDKIKLDIKEILETDPPIIISKSLMLMD